MTKLYAFAISHYSEKARWALDHKGIDYEYKALVPGPHILTTKRLKLAKTSVPILQDSGGVIQGSSEIITHLDQLYPTRSLTPTHPDLFREATEWECSLDQQVGDDLRRILYASLLKHPSILISLWTQGASAAWVKPVMRLGYPMLAHKVRRLYKITPERVSSSIASFDAIMARLEARLASHPFLIGDQLTRVDIPAAALLAPIIQPVQHPFTWSTSFPQELIETFSVYHNTSTWQWVERLYAERRTQLAPEV